VSTAYGAFAARCRDKEVYDLLKRELEKLRR